MCDEVQKNLFSFAAATFLKHVSAYRSRKFGNHIMSPVLRDNNYTDT